MRLMILAAVAVSIIPAPSAASGPANYDYRRTWPKSIEEHNAKLRASGWEYLNQHVRNRDDLIVLAQKCRRYVARPDYCAIPAMQSIAYPD